MNLNFCKKVLAKVFVDNKNTGIIIDGKLIFNDKIRITNKSYNKMRTQLNDFCESNNLKDGYFTLWFTYNDKIFVYDYYCSFGESYERGYFISSYKNHEINFIKSKYKIAEYYK